MNTDSGSDIRVLKCSVAYNKYGGYCVPTSSQHRPAAQAILAGGVWEPDTIEFMVKHVGDGDIVHAGTYFGDFVPALSRACVTSAKVWAFEPNPENYRCALITNDINGLENVEIRNVGLGSRSAVQSMRIADDSGRALGGGSRLVPNTQKDDGKIFRDVDVVALDGQISPKAKVTVIQFDLEGFEKSALIGAMGIIRRRRPILILETLPDDAWLAENLFSLGYEVSGKLHANSVLVTEQASK